MIPDHAPLSWFGKTKGGSAELASPKIAPWPVEFPEGSDIDSNRLEYIADNDTRDNLV